VIKALKQRGYRMLWVEDAQPLQNNQLPNFNDKFNARLNSLDEDNTVTFTAFEQIKVDLADDSDKQYLLIEQLKDIYPLDNKLGSWERVTAPEPLQTLLFSSLQTFGGDHNKNSIADSDKELNTYAILDAAKFYFFTNTDSATGLNCECLFDSSADEHLLESAPYIIELVDKNQFTQQLFTQADKDVPWHLWDKAPCIFIRSTANIFELKQHFKKFVRMRDEKNTPFFMRFYDPTAMTAYWPRISHMSDRVQLWFQPTNCALIHSIISYDVKRNESGIAVAQGIVIKPNPQYLPFAAHPILRDKDKVDLDLCKQLTFEQQTQRIFDELKQMFPDQTTFPEKETEQLFNELLALYKRMYAYGFTIYRQLQTMLTWGLFYGFDFVEHDPDGQLIKICHDQQLNNADKFTLFKQQIYQLAWDTA
jgi:hypothetical protein